MKALIMAGGEGTRLRPLTCNIPKPMVPVMNKPVMEHIINLLKKHNITEIAVTLQYMPKVIQEYFGNGSDFGVEIEYFIEEQPLGTAGSVKNAESFLDDTFIVISGDALTDINLSKAIEFHNKNNALATLVLTKVEVPLEYGVVVTGSNGRISRFLEKPSWSEVFSDTVNTGIYVLHPKVLDYFNKGEKFDFSKDLFPILLREKRALFGYVSEDYWCDIGDLEAYQKCHFDIFDGRVSIDNTSKELFKNVWVEENVEIGKNVQITGPVLIGKNSCIKDYVEISPYTVVGRENFVGEYSTLKRAVTWSGCNIGRRVSLRGCIIGNKVQIKDGSSLFEYSVAGEQTIIKERAVIKPGIKIWPFKTIENDTELSMNMVWGAKHSKTLFGEKGILGEINVDVIPEFASRLGASFGALMGNKAKVAISNDEANACNMLRKSFVAGLLSAGLEVFDFGVQFLPITRSAIRFYGLDGGIHLGMVSTDYDSKVEIDIMNSSGINVDRGTERKLENIFSREDFYRSETNAIKSVKTVTEYKEYYLRHMVNKMKNRQLKYKIIIDTPSELFKGIFSPLLEEIGCKLNVVNDCFDRPQKINCIIEKVIASGSDLGVLISRNCEKMLLIDEKGRKVNDEIFMTLIALITFETNRDTSVVVPISAPSVIDKLAERYNGKVVRTKTSQLEIMDKMIDNINKDKEINDQFILNFDALGGLLKIMDYMKTNELKLSELLDRIPSFHISKREVACPWDAKGKVIREILQENVNEKVELTEGVKIYKEGGWVLILPDSERAVCKVIGEGYSNEFAESLTDFFSDRVKEIGCSGTESNISQVN